MMLTSALDKRSDTELVQGVLAGSEGSFVELLNRYSEKVHNLAIRISRNEEDAEEILQDVFVTVHRKLHKFEGKSAFSSWLYRITANTAFMKLRKRKQSLAMSIEDISPVEKENWLEQSTESGLNTDSSLRHELRDQIEAAISKLPEEYKMIFIMRDVDGLSNEEVGLKLNLTVPAVKSRLHRSRLMLRRKLAAYYQEFNDAPVTATINEEDLGEMQLAA